MVLEGGRSAVTGAFSPARVHPVALLLGDAPKTESPEGPICKDSLPGIYKNLQRLICSRMKSAQILSDQTGGD